MRKQTYYHAKTTLLTLFCSEGIGCWLTLRYVSSLHYICHNLHVLHEWIAKVRYIIVGATAAAVSNVRLKGWRLLRIPVLAVFANEWAVFGHPNWKASDKPNKNENERQLERKWVAGKSILKWNKKHWKSYVAGNTVFNFHKISIEKLSLTTNIKHQKWLLVRLWPRGTLPWFSSMSCIESVSDSGGTLRSLVIELRICRSSNLKFLIPWRNCQKAAVNLKATFSNH